jgi:iron complex outermembrane receptor protein
MQNNNLFSLKITTMKTRLFSVLILMFFSLATVVAQENKDSLKVRNLNEVIVSGTRNDVPLKEIPSAISIVGEDQLGTMTKSIAADEELRLVPGVKIDNGTDGSRVHLYIRGQGVLSESGFRGIDVLIDGIPVNDPGGFCPDLYDVDWQTVKSVEVIKGLAASMYGGSANGGVVNIITKDGGDKPVSDMLYASAGSYGFWKTLEQVDGTKDNVNYRISYSHMQGDGYRAHQAFLANNFSEKLNWAASGKVKITQTLTYTDYFNQNSEGINIEQYDSAGPRSANPDAIPYNEFHETKRITGATIGKFIINKNQNVELKGFFRLNDYRETSNGGDDYKPFIGSGCSAQYNIDCGKENLRNHFSVGADFESQRMTEQDFAVPDEDHINHGRVDNHFGMECFDTDVIQINQIIRERSAGAFIIDKLDISKKLFATLNVRYDYVYNQLNNHIPVPDSLNPNGSKEFEQPTFRFGLAYDACKYANIYANIGTAFLVPTEDELYNNPKAYGGFNESIKPSTSTGEEFGIRGDISKQLHYDITGFNIASTNEFYRFSIPARGNNTAFFGNIGKSSRTGAEVFVSYAPVKILRFDIAYTYSHFVYVSPDSVKNHWIPECPQHILDAEASVKITKNFTFTLGIEYQSKWWIQVDDSIYNQFTGEYGIKHDSWYKGFTILSANLTYSFKIGTINGDIGVYAKNMLDEHYFGFTEPNNWDPKVPYNSYQPAPGREVFASLKLRF